VPNTDEYLTDQNNKPDDITDMYRDAIDLLTGHHSDNKTEAEHYQTTNITKSYYTSYDKGSTSKNPIVNLLLERLSLNYNSSYTLSQNAKGRITPQSNIDYIDDLTSRSYSGSIKYDLSPKPAPDWTKWKPLGKTRLLWLPDRVKNYELSLLPTTLNFNVASIEYHTSEDKKAREQTDIATKNLTLAHSGTFAWDPINILNLNYSLNINRNLDNFVTGPNWSSLRNFDDLIKIMHQIRKPDDAWRKYFILNGERDRTQTSSIKLDPTIWDWLTMSTDYSANYKQNSATLANDPTPYENMGVDSKYHLTTTLTLATLFKNLSDALPNAKAVKSVLGSIEKALNKIQLNSFSFNYDASLSLINNNMNTAFLSGKNIDMTDLMRYQLGITKGRKAWDLFTGDMPDTILGGMKYRNGDNSPGTLQPINTLDKRTTTRSFSINSGLNLPEPISISIGTLGLKWSQSFSAQPDPTTKDSSIIFPDIDVSGSTQMLNKIKLVNNFLQAVSMSSSFNYQNKITKTYTTSSSDSIATTTYRFSPLVGLDGKLKKWPVNLTYSHTWNNSTESKRTAGTTETIEHDNKVGATYELQKSGNVSEFKLLFWTLPLKGTFTLGVEGELGSTDNITHATKDAPEQSVNASSVSFTPHTSYTFSDNITGEAHYSFSEKKEKSQTTTSHIFALSVTVNLK
jgi:hypothetical protein